MSILDLYKQRKDKNLEELQKYTEKLSNSGGFQEDNRFWKPQRDKSGNGSALIRFLPGKIVGNVVKPPYIKYYDHAFKGPTGRWYIEKSRTTIGEPDPVTDYNSILWNSGIDKYKEQARRQKRREKYVANILVLNDPAKPENNGKVFLFEFGPQIFNIIKDMIKPQFDDQEPVDVFDPFEGRNFRLRIVSREISTPNGKVAVPNYEKSAFDSNPSEVENFEEIYEQMYDLDEFTDPSTFKSYDELKKKFCSVINITEDEFDAFVKNQGGAPSLVNETEQKIEKTEPIVDLAKELDDDVPFMDDKNDQSNDEKLDIDSLLKELE